MKNIRLSVFLIMFVLIVGGVIALFSSQASGGNGKTDSPTAYIEATTLNSSFKVGGRIKEILVEEGDYVKKGQVLARLESEELENKVAQAQAALYLTEGKIIEASGAKSAAVAKEDQGSQAVTITEQTIVSQINQAEAAVEAAKANVQALETKISSAKELYEISNTNYERMVVLQKEGAVAQLQVDEARSKLETAKAEYYSALEQKKAAKAQVDQAQATLQNAIANRGKIVVSKKDVEVANATVSQTTGAVESAVAAKKQAEAALAEAKTYLSYTELVAPADGVIITKSAQLGEMINTGFPIFTIETTDPRYADFYFDETAILDLQVGDSITADLIAANQQIEGVIKSISPAGDFAIKKATQNIGDTDIRSFAVKVEFLDLPSEIPTGVTVKWVGKGVEK